MPHSFEANLSQTAFPADDPAETECRIEIDPDESRGERLPLHIVFCIDRSGSMSGTPIRLAKKGVRNAMQKLDGRDTFGVVAFDNDADVVVDPTSGDHTSGVNLSSLQAGGGTHIINGLEQSRSLIERMGSGGGLTSFGAGDQDAVQWIALVTDGKPSDVGSALSTLVGGLTGDVVGGKVEKHGAVAEALNDDGITVNTAGVGSGYNEDIIEEISSRSGGTWEHHSSESGIRDFFEGKIEEAHSVVIPNPTLTVEPKNGVDVAHIKRTVPQIAEVEATRKGSSYVVTDFPDIRSDVAPEYIADLEVPAHEMDPEVTFAEVSLEIGSDVLTDRVNGEFTIDTDMAGEMDEGNKEITRESEIGDTYLGRKEDLDKETRDEESRGIKRRK